MVPPARSPKGKRAQEKPRLDVSTPVLALKHSPFAALGGVAPPATALPVTPAGAEQSAPVAPATAQKPGLVAPATAQKSGPVVSAGAEQSAPVAPAVAMPPVPAGKPRGRLILRRETKHRGGKAVVIVSGFAQLSGISDRALDEILHELKQRLGCGGTVSGRELLLQGDRPAQVAALLRERGFRVDGVTS